MLYEWVVYLHVLSVLLFIAAHGVAMALSFSIRGAKTRESAIGMLVVSETSTVAMYVTLIALLATGITAGIMGDFWRSGWFWASLVVLVAIVAAMVPLGAIRFAMIRRYAGVAYRVQGKVQPAEPADEAKMFAEIALVRADLLAIVGIGGLAIVLWLMMMKPF